MPRLYATPVICKNVLVKKTTIYFDYRFHNIVYGNVFNIVHKYCIARN